MIHLGLRFLERAKELVCFKPEVNHGWISWFLHYVLFCFPVLILFILNSTYFAPSFHNTKLRYVYHSSLQTSV